MNRVASRPKWAPGTFRDGVEHYSYVFRQPNPNAYGHHKLTQERPGARGCGLCGRWVVRGMGRWWER